MNLHVQSARPTAGTGSLADAGRADTRIRGFPDFGHRRQGTTVLPLRLRELRVGHPPERSTTRGGGEIYPLGPHPERSAIPTACGKTPGRTIGEKADIRALAPRICRSLRSAASWSTRTLPSHSVFVHELESNRPGRARNGTGLLSSRARRSTAISRSVSWQMMLSTASYHAPSVMRRYRRTSGRLGRWFGPISGLSPIKPFG